MIALGAIADDFTGATDLAGLLARSGVQVNLRIGVPDTPPEGPAPFEVVALKIRTAPVDDAVAQALAALDWLRAGGVRHVFWKYCSTFDSTDDGNIGPVAEALMDALSARQTIYCPAFPENGRSVFMGNLFVGQAPLAESPMKDHPLTPMRDSNLMRLLAPQVVRDVGLIDRRTVARGARAIRDALKDAAPHVVIDAVADDDLDAIARACRDMALMTGGSAVAAPLPDLYRADGLISDAALADLPEPPPRDAVILSGSCSAMTRRQVAAYPGPKLQLDPLALAEDGPEDMLDWLSEQTLSDAPLLYATAEPDAVRAAQAELGRAQAGELVEDALSEAARAARIDGARRFVVAGGETSGAVTQALGIDRLRIGPEIAPGVPWCFATSDGHDVAITLKSGNFGSEDFFARALAAL